MAHNHENRSVTGDRNQNINMLMDKRGFYFIDGIRYFRLSHWDGYDYFIPWVGDVPPTFEEASAAIFDWWQYKDTSRTKRFK